MVDTIICKKNTARRTVLIVIAAVILVAAAVGGWLWYRAANKVPEVYCVELQLIGEETVTLEYGEEYVELGAAAVGYGTVEDLSRVAVEVNISHDMDLQQIGSYTVTYTAQYNGVSRTAERKVEVVDTTPPEIQLTQIPDSYTLPGQTYQEEGFTAFDSYDGDVTGLVERTEAEGVVTYTVTDSSGNQARAQRKIFYNDPEPPVLTLLGEQVVTIQAGEEWVDSGCTATDNADGDLTQQIQVDGEVDPFVAGSYQLTYQVADSYGNTASVERTVVVEPVAAPDSVAPNGKVIYLTFDDGPWEDTPELLSVLDKYQVKATFFVIKTKYIDMLKDIADAGHSIGIHSKTHRYETIYSSEDAFFDDLYDMQDIIYQHTGIRTTLIRFPGGSSNRVSQKYCTGIMTRLVKAVESLGFQYFDWNVDSDDAGNAKTADAVYQNVIEGVQDQQYAVVLMHDTQSYSVDAVERIIRWGLENGYTFRALEETSPVCHHKWIKN